MSAQKTRPEASGVGIRNPGRRNQRVCVIDANPKFRAEVASALLSFYEVSELWEQGAALEAIAFDPPAAIILDENVTPRGGLPLLREICCVPELDRIPVICTAAPERRAFLADAALLGVRTTLTKPFRRSLLLAALSAEINGKIERNWIKIEPVQRAALQKTTALFNSIADAIGSGESMPYETLRAACEPLLQAIASGNYSRILDGVRDHDNYTYVHSLRVAVFLSVLGHAIGLRDRDLSILAAGGMIHDIGKLSVPSHILNKSGRLTDEEWAIMQGHVPPAERFLHLVPDLQRGALIIATQHHEKLDGSGYPHGLKGAELDDLTRMANIVDIFCALTDWRPYKEALDPEHAFFIMRQQPAQLDQGLMKVFREVLLDTARRG